MELYAMKKIFLVTLALILVLFGASVTACGSKDIGLGDNTIHIPDSEGGGDITLQGGGKTPENFGDIPLYPGSEQIMKITADETMDGQPGILDHRVYLTSDSVEKVISFYKEKMPGNGWTEESWYESTINMGTYNKGEQNIAVIGVVPADAQGSTNITIDKKYVK
jgi:hypothetical protein